MCLVLGVVAFIYNAEISYKVNKDFVSIPLQFNPDDSSSVYKTQNAQITINGGFVKGIQKSKEGTESLVIRALSPLPIITVKGNNATSITLLIENINPDFYAKSIISAKLPTAKVKDNTLQLSITVNAMETKKLNLYSQRKMSQENTHTLF